MANDHFPYNPIHFYLYGMNDAELNFKIST